MKLIILAISAGCALGPMSASAVSLNARGLAQVLLYPYYTVNHQQTLLTVANTTSHGKALKVRFREGYDGRDVANFNVYLGPYDSWVAAVYDSSADGLGAAVIATTDTSCTVPEFAAMSTGLRSLTFTNSNYSQGAYGSPTGIDSGPSGLDRTREGSIEIIEMGELVDQASGGRLTLGAITPSPTVSPPAPPNCAQVVAAWRAGGYWTFDATTDLAPPAGGLFGSVGIVNVEEGTLYAVDAAAIDGFSDVAQHTAPGSLKPNLSTAVTDSLQGIATAFVQVGNGVVRADYPLSRAVDAVSAVIMAATLNNEFNVEQSLGASSDWVVSLPTKNFYVDPGIVGTTPQSVIQPFSSVFGGGLVSGNPATPGGSCDGVIPDVRDRGGVASPPCGVQCPQSQHYTCLQTNVLDFKYGPGRNDPSGALGSMLVSDHVMPGPTSGQVVLYMYDPLHPIKPSLRPASDGTTFYGLPSIGFDAEKYINANVTPGVLSNYTGAYPHRAKAVCTKPSSACGQ